MAIKGISSSLTLILAIITTACNVSASNYQFEMVRDINPNGNSDPSRLERLETTEDGQNNKMFFVANDGVHSTEPWISDGTFDGTKLLKDLRPGDFGSGKGSNIDAHGKIYFVANDGINGDELWSSDGTSTGTKMIKDIFPGSIGSSPRYMIEKGELVYFFAKSSDTSGWQLWKTDGSEANTVQITNKQGGFSVKSGLTNFRNLLAFSSENDDGHRSIWKVDGDTVTQVTEPELEVITYSRLGRSDTTEVLGKFYFSAATANGVALYSTDLTTTIKIKDDIQTTQISRRMVDNQRVLFFASGTGTDLSLWVTDGTTDGTQLLLDNLNMSFLLHTYDGKTFFLAEDSSFSGLKLYASDGTVQGTNIIFNFDSSNIIVPKAGSKMGENGPFFIGLKFGTAYQIWLIEGAHKQPVKLREFLADEYLNNYQMEYLNDETILFNTYDTNTGMELWKISKTTTSTSSASHFIHLGKVFILTTLCSLTIL